MNQLHLQLYARTETKEFDEKLSVREIVTLGAEPAAVELSLNAPPGDELVEIRLDPDDKPSTFMLHQLKIRSSGGAELYSWDGDPASLKTLVDVQARRGRGGTVLESISNDPFLLIPLANREAIGLVVELSVSQQLIFEEGSGTELADAVRSLQSSLRCSLDDLVDQQEGLQDALVVHQSHSRSETAALKKELAQVLERVDSVPKRIDGRTKAIEASIRELALTSEKTRKGLEGALVAHQAHSRSETAALKKELAQVLERMDSVHDRIDGRTKATEASIRELALTSEQTRKGLEGALVAHQAHSRSETAALKKELAQVLERVDSGHKRIDGRTKAIEASIRELALTSEKTRKGLEGALVAHQAHSRSETVALKKELAQVLERVDSVHDRIDGRTKAIEASIRELALTSEKTRDEIFCEVREDWRSVRGQITEAADAVLRQGREQSSELSSRVLAEIAVLTQAVHRLAGSQAVIKEIQRELEISRNEDVLPAVKRLKAEGRNACDRLSAIESRWPWRLARPFLALSNRIHER